MTNMRTVDRPNEVHYDFEESCYVEGDSQSLVKVKAKSDPPARGGEQCAVLPRLSSSLSRSRRGHKLLHDSKSSNGSVVFH